jgi:type II secretory pathway pseudopilin PulG
MKFPRPFFRRRGFGLLEVIVVFALVIGAAAVTFTVFTSANASSSASALTDDLKLVASNLRSSPWGLAHDYTTLDVPSAIKAGLFPKGLLQDGLPTTPYGPINLSVSYVGPRQFDINTNFIPDSGAECAKTVAAFAAVGFDDVLVAGSGPDDSGGSILTNGKVDMTKVGFWCSGANTSGASVGIDLIGH